jgi:hypothetical protein
MKNNDLVYLHQWCADYYKTNTIKINPHNAPLDIIVNELLGRVIKLEGVLDVTNSILSDCQAQIAKACALIKGAAK